MHRLEAIVGEPLMKKITSIVVIFLITGLAGEAQADPVTWTLSGATFDDGGTAIGSFVFDADTSTYLTLSIATTSGSAYGGASYSTGDVSDTLFGGSDDTGLRLVRNQGESILAINFVSPLTNAGGSIPLGLGSGNVYFEGDCTTPACESGATFRELTGGSVTTMPVPAAAIPTMSVYGLALTMLGLLLVAARHLSRRRAKTG